MGQFAGPSASRRGRDGPVARAEPLEQIALRFTCPCFHYFRGLPKGLVIDQSIHPLYQELLILSLQQANTGNGLMAVETWCLLRETTSDV